MKTWGSLILNAVVIFTLLITSCKPSREKVAGSIREMEERIFSPQSGGFSKASADSLVAKYDEFITRFPADTLSARYLLMAGQVTMNGGDGLKSVGYFDRFMKDFPDHPKAPMCLFFKAFVYENTLHDLARAKEGYEAFIRKYPDHEFADDAQLSLMNLGKTPEQIVKEFEAKKR